MDSGAHEQPTAAAQPPTDVAAPAANHRQPLSLRPQIVQLVLALLIPSVLLTTLLLWNMAEQAYHTQERQLAATARTLALVVDGRIGEQAAALEALSVSPLLAQADWPGFAAQARAALRGSDAWVAVRGADGRQLVNTFGGSGQATPLTQALIPKATWAGQRGAARVSNVIWGPAAHQPVVVVIKPLVLADGSSVDVAVTQPAASFSKLLKRQELPPRWTAAILDGDRRVVARNRTAEKYVGVFAGKQIAATISASPRGVTRGRTLDGIATITAYDELPGYRWTAVVSMPRDEATGEAGRAVLLGVLAGLLLLSVGVLLALRTGARIAAPVEGLARTAFDWVQGRQARFPTSTGLRETDELSRAFAAALRAVQERDERQTLLINELNHRVKNTLATVQAIAMHSRRGIASVEDFHRALEGRIIAMGRAHELLTRSSWEGAEMGELAREALEAFTGPRLTISGPRARLAPTDALNLALILHELATNAVKHGALSNDSGVVRLSWKRAPGRIHVCWAESGGPVVVPPTRRGFGSRLIAHAAEDLQPSRLEYAPEGLRCELTVRTLRGEAE